MRSLIAFQDLRFLLLTGKYEIDSMSTEEG